MEQINEVPGKKITIVKSHELRTKFSGTHLRTRRQPEEATCILIHTVFGSYRKYVSFVFTIGIQDIVSIESITGVFRLRLRCADRCADSMMSG